MTTIGQAEIYQPTPPIIPDGKIRQIISDCPAIITRIILSRSNWFFSLFNSNSTCHNCHAVLCEIDITIKVPPLKGCIDQNKTINCDKYAYYCAHCQYLRTYPGDISDSIKYP